MAVTDVSSLEGGLYADKGYAVITCSVVFIIACTLAIILRFFTHLFVQRSQLGVEDWILIPAWVLMMGFCATVILSVTIGGVARHEAYILKYEPRTMQKWAQILLAVEIMYGVTIALVKTSILCLYLRLFRVQRWFRWTVYGFIAYIWAWALSEILVAIFQCQPISFQWDKSVNGRCIQQLQFFRWISVPNVMHDIAMLVLPIPAVWKLQINNQKKTALLAVFLVGTMGCIASFIRLAAFWKLDAFADDTWASIQLMSWTLAEPGVIFICACLPSLWPLLRRFVPRPGRSRLTKYANESGRSGPSSFKRCSKGHKPLSTSDCIPLNHCQSEIAVSNDPSRPGQTQYAPTASIRVTTNISWTSTTT